MCNINYQSQYSLQPTVNMKYSKPFTYITLYSYSLVIDLSEKISPGKLNNVINTTPINVTLPPCMLCTSTNGAASLPVIPGVSVTGTHE